MVTRIHHHIAAKNADLAVYLQELTGETELRISELLALGAIYLNKKRLSHSDITPIFEGDYLRIHSEPRRYPVHQIDWRQQIHFENQDLVVIDKISGIPTHPTLDNGIENCMTQVSRVCGTDLFITHRLDLPTSGLLIFAKTAAAQKSINEAFAQNNSTKLYRALMSQPGPELGLMEHWMKKSKRAPKEIFSQPGFETQLCQLSVKSKQFLNQYCEAEIQLLTGRTHQIRAQMAHTGFPILGDLAYGGLPTKVFSTEWEKIALQSYHLSIIGYSWTLDRPKEWECDLVL